MIIHLLVGTRVAVHISRREGGWVGDGLCANRAHIGGSGQRQTVGVRLQFRNADCHRSARLNKYIEPVNILITKWFLLYLHSCWWRHFSTITSCRCLSVVVRLVPPFQKFEKENGHWQQDLEEIQRSRQESKHIVLNGLAQRVGGSWSALRLLQDFTLSNGFQEV